MKTSVSALVRRYSDRFSPPLRAPDDIVDLAVEVGGAARLDVRGLGDRLHAAFAAEIDGGSDDWEMRPWVLPLVDWLYQAGVHRIEPEWQLARRRVWGQCDALLSGGPFRGARHGLLEIKSRRELPTRFPETPDEHQLGLYADLLEFRASRVWGVMAYFSPRQRAWRLYLWHSLDAHARAAHRLLRAA